MGQPLNTQYAEVSAGFWRGLAHPIRLKVLQLLRVEGPMPVGAIAEALALGQGHLSNHLSCLKTCGFVRVVPDGRYAYYQLADDRVAALLDLGEAVMRDHVLGVMSCVVVRAEGESGLEESGLEVVSRE